MQNASENRGRPSSASIGIVIPAYQAAATLGAVLRRIPAQVWSRARLAVVVDDGSTDATSREARALSREFPISITRFDRNRGYGAAVSHGLDRLRRARVDAAVCLHADGQYPPESIPEGFHLMQAQGLDLLQGSRHLAGTALDGGMPRYKYLAGKVLVRLENRVLGLGLTDYHSGMLFYGPRALGGLPFDRLGRGFEFDLEVLACARSHGFRVGEFAIPTRYATEISHLNPLAYGLRVLGVLWKYRRGAYAPGARAGKGLGGDRGVRRDHFAAPKESGL